VFWKPRVKGDWNLDGTSDSIGSSSGDWMRQGYQRHFNVLSQAMPGKFQLGNIADWGGSDTSLTFLSGVLNGGVMEGAIGMSWSAETWGGWQEMMRQYRKTMSVIAEPKLVIFNQHGSPKDYQGFRYGFASCLMDDAYYGFTDSAVEYTGLPWFDEYNAKLGNSTSSPSTSPWQNGVYRREFQNGIALVNPKGNGTRTVQLETNFQRLAGKQDGTTNNGQVTRTVTLKDRDGIILMRIGAQAQTQAKPQAPGTVVVQ
jgi:hypothetical protein